ncbi:MAG: helix-turn-helix domain-containing protein [Intestinimonas sp.]
MQSLFPGTRVNAAIRALQAGPPSLTRLAQELGYFDQSHFIHEFKSVCGVSPGRYLAHMSGFYKEPLKP